MWLPPNCNLRPQKFDSLELTEEKINAITDKIPQRPVGVVEGTSYTAVILAAFGVRSSLHLPTAAPNEHQPLDRLHRACCHRGSHAASAIATSSLSPPSCASLPMPTSA